MRVHSAAPGEFVALQAGRIIDGNTTNITQVGLPAHVHDTALTTLAPTGVNAVTCAVDGCARVPRARGLCLMHYRRHRRHGDTDRRRSGRRVIDEKTRVVNQLFTDWSPRTRERYTRAWRLAEFAGVRIEELIQRFSRPNGTIRVDAMLERAEGLAAMKVAREKAV